MPDLQLILRMDRTVHPCLQKNIENKKKHFLRNEIDVSPKNKKTKMTAMSRSIDSNTRFTICYWKINENRGIGKKYGFHHASSFPTLNFQCPIRPLPSPARPGRKGRASSPSVDVWGIFGRGFLFLRNAQLGRCSGHSWQESLFFCRKCVCFYVVVFFLCSSPT